MPTIETLPPVVGSCRGCGYALQGLESQRCPECGRVFDPADPATMNMGRKPGWIARKLLKPIGWPTVLLLLAAAAAIAYTTRPQERNVWEWELSWVDLKLYGDRQWWEPAPSVRSALSTPTDWTYAIGVAAVACLAGWAILRTTVSLLTRLRYRAAPGPRLPRLATLSAVSVILLFAALCVLAGWPYRTGQNAAARMRYAATITPPVQGPVVNAGVAWAGMSDDQARTALLAVLRHGDPALARAAVAQAAEAEPITTIRALLERSLRPDADPSVQQAAIRLAGVLRDMAYVDLLVAMLDSPHPHLRADAIDALNLIDQDTGVGLPADRVEGDPGFAVAQQRFITAAAPAASAPGGPPEVPIVGRTGLPDLLRERARLAMINGVSVAEHEAAARYLLRVPPSRFTLRVAEWGVWGDDAGSDVRRSAHDLLDEIPPFVHQFNDTLSQIELPPRFITVFKPVVHFTSSVPMVVDLRVQIRQGRVQFVAPMPCRYSASTTGDVPTQQPLAPFESTSGKPLESRRVGMPWLKQWDLVNPRQGINWGEINAPGTETITGLGFHWQSLMILPEKPSWLAPPVVPADPKYAWWSRLRDVPCSWVSARGESDRFLFYDGPTLLPSPVKVRQGRDSVLLLEYDGRDRRGTDARRRSVSYESYQPMVQTGRSERRGQRRGMYVTVAGGKVSAEVAPIESGDMKPERPTHRLGTGKVTDGPDAEITAAEALLRNWVIDAGLTDEEADGMMFAWRKHFFQTEGRRFVLLMSADDYDDLCPMDIRPQPTELVRVGLVWTELE